MIRKKITDLIQKSIKEAQKNRTLFSFKIPEIQVEKPERKELGDYATNIAMIIAREVKKNPMEIANILGSRVWALGFRFFEKVEVAKPGFINFFISKKYLQKQTEEILKQKEKFGDLEIGKNKKINIEFISANPTGPLHIGNGRGAFWGDCLANVLEKSGFKVIRECYINDGKLNTQIRILGKTALGKGIIYLTKDLKIKIKKLKPKFKKITKEGEAGYLLAREVQKDIKSFIKKKLKIKFNNWVFEEDLYKKNKIDKIYNLFKKKKLIYKKEGAEWLKISKFGAPKDEVIIRKTGDPTYFLSDSAYHKDKFDRGFNKIINIWGADHQGHIHKIKAIAKILNFKGDLNILISQIIRLKGGIKLSKRKGEIITLEYLVDEVGLDAARFFYLMKSLSSQMEFDIKIAKERSEKSPVYYVQYAHARISSILRKAQNNFQFPWTSSSELPGGLLFNFQLLTHPLELNLIKQLIRFPEIIEDTARDYQVQRIPQYAIDLATVFHQFYRNCKVITKDTKLKKARLSLIIAVKIVLKNTLDLIGVSAPLKM